MLRAIFLEMIYRSEPDLAPGTAYVQPPDWLLDGTLAIVPGRGNDGLVDTLRTAVASQTVPTLEEFLRQRPALLDSPSRNLYRAEAAALVSALSDSAEDRKRLARYVADLPRSGNDPAADLRMHFPELGDSAEKSEKTWSLQLAGFLSRERFHLLGTDETERELKEILQVQLRGPDGAPIAYALEEFPAFVRNPAAKSALQIVTQKVMLLSARSNPLYLPVLREYEQIATLLFRGKTNKITERLARVREIREHIGRRMSSIGDYMNWFEATQSRGPSNQFREYLKAAEQASNRGHHRRDPISIYLDAFEAELEN